MTASPETVYDGSKPIPTLEVILRSPIQTISPKAIVDLKARRKYLADIFFDKNKSVQEKKAVQDELADIHKYLGMADIRKIGDKSPKTAEQRKKNCEAFKEYIGEKHWHSLSAFEQALTLAKLWGT